MRLLLMTCALLTVTIALSQSQIADVVFLNGKIWTVDKTKPEAEAVAVLGGPTARGLFLRQQLAAQRGLRELGVMRMA